jgi:hypothetical protein
MSQLPSEERMRARGYAELTTTELPDELQFRVVHHDGWINLIAVPIICLFPFYFLWQGWKHRNSWQLVVDFLIFVLLLTNIRRPVAKWLHGRATKLTVTSREFVATGNLVRLFTSAIKMPMSEARKLSYWTWNGSDGLYVNRGQSIICLLPGLNESQTKTAINAIFGRFPEIESKVGVQASLRSGNIVS